MWRKNILIPFLIGARYPRDQQMILKIWLFSTLSSLSFKVSWFVYSICFTTRIQAESIFIKRFSSFSVPQWNRKTLRLYPLTGCKKHLQTRRRIWLVTSDLKRELGGCTSRVQAFPEWGNGYFSGPKTRKNDTTQTWESFWRWSCMVEHVETESCGRYENDRPEFFIKFLYLWHSWL